MKTKTLTYAFAVVAIAVVGRTIWSFATYPPYVDARYPNLAVLALLVLITLPFIKHPNMIPFLGLTYLLGIGSLYGSAPCATAALIYTAIAVLFQRKMGVKLNNILFLFMMMCLGYACPWLIRFYKISGIPHVLLTGIGMGAVSFLFSLPLISGKHKLLYLPNSLISGFGAANIWLGVGIRFMPLVVSPLVLIVYFWSLFLIKKGATQQVAPAAV